MEASQRNCCSLSRRAASISVGVGAIPRLFFCVIGAPRHGPRGEHYSTCSSLGTEFGWLFWVKRYRAFAARPAQKSALARKPT